MRKVLHLWLGGYLPLLGISILLLCSAPNLFAQDRTKVARSELDKMFQALDRTSVPTGFLRDYALEYEDLDAFTGKKTLSESNLLNPMRYADVLTTIQSSCLDKEDAQHLVQRFRQVLNFESSPHLSLVLYKYSRLRADALNASLIRYENGQVFNLPGKNPYQEEVVFAACVLADKLETNTVWISYSKALEFSNCKINQIEVAYKGNRKSLKQGDKIALELDSGENRIVVTVTTEDNQTYSSHCSVYVDSQGTTVRSAKMTMMPSPNEEYFVTGEAYKGVVTQAKVSVRYAKGNSSIRRPLFIVEGFDPHLEKLSHGFWSYYRIDSPLANFAYDKGFDIVYVDWVHPEEYIQANAKTLEAIISRINRQKARHGSKERGVVLAHSMGGLILRYALATMEKKGLAHEVGTYISYDVPHLGAHIPIGVLYGFYGIQKFIESRGLAGEMAMQFANFSDMLELGKKYAYSTSAQQMLINYVDPAGNFNNQEHQTWQKELEELGFPQGDAGNPIRLLSVANGSYETPKLPDLYLKTSFEAGSSVLPAVHTLGTLFGGVTIGAVAFGLNDVISGLLTILPGRSSVQGHCEIFPAISLGTIVTDIKMSYANKFLWLIPITRTLFEFVRYAPNSLSFEQYPSSTYAIPRRTDYKPIVENGEGGLGLLYDYEYDIVVKDKISFIPTSSALAVGSGLSLKPQQFLEEPQADATPFREHVFVHARSESHNGFTGLGLEWVFAQLDTSIVGPDLGYNGARYSLSGHSPASTLWSTSNPKIAMIDPQGHLAVHGSEGIVRLVAKSGSFVYNKDVVVGLPRCILKASHQPGGYEVVATVVNKQFEGALHLLKGSIKYNWGIKKKDAPIVWQETDDPQLNLQLTEEQERVVVLLEISDIYGNKLPIVHTSIVPQAIFYTTYSTWFLSDKGELYIEDFEVFPLEIAYIDLHETDNISSQYTDANWMPFTATILSPSGRKFRVELSNMNVMMQDVLNTEELAWIHKHCSDNQELIYLVGLENYEEKVIQYLPIRITYKTDL